MFLDRLIDRLSGEGPVLKPSEALAEQMADPVWEASPLDEAPQAPEPEIFEPQKPNRKVSHAAKPGKPSAPNHNLLVSNEPLVQFESSERNAEKPLPDEKSVAGESRPHQSRSLRKPRSEGPEPVDENSTTTAVPETSPLERRPSKAPPSEPAKPDPPVVRLLPSASEPPEEPATPAFPSRPDPSIPAIEDNAGIEVTVHIGQIETAAPQPVQPAYKPAVRKRAPRPLLSLQDYMENRRKGAR